MVDLDTTKLTFFEESKKMSNHSLTRLKKLFMKVIPKQQGLRSDSWSTGGLKLGVYHIFPQYFLPFFMSKSSFWFLVRNTFGSFGSDCRLQTPVVNLDLVLFHK